MSFISNEQALTLQGAISITAPAATVQNIKEINNEYATTWYFDVITDESIELINQITDNYVENNTAIQDHIAQNPLVITISGISGEKVFKYDPVVANQLLAEARLQAAKMGYGINLNNRQADSFWDLINLGSKAKELNKLSAISVLYPPVSNYMQVAMNAVELVDTAVSKYTNMYNSIFNKEPGNEQIFGRFIDQNEKLVDEDGNRTIEPRLHVIYNKLSELRANNTPLTATTPWGIFTDMYIQSVRLKQGNQLYVTDIEMTLKQLRFSNVTTTAADKNVMAQYNAWARAKAENNGTAQGNNVSLLKQGKGLGLGN